MAAGAARRPTAYASPAAGFRSATTLELERRKNRTTLKKVLDQPVLPFVLGHSLPDTFSDSTEYCHSERPLRLCSGQAPGAKNLNFSRDINAAFERLKYSPTLENFTSPTTPGHTRLCQTECSP